jgi:glycosyltransferase involved in cell wall biosynthesis
MNISDPYVSIVIPCYNVELYIIECLDSVFRQTYSNVEVICVDNNSTDNTVQLIKSYRDSQKVDIQLVFETKKGASAARNKGLLVAKGDWIQFLDADDLLEPQKIERQLSFVKENQKVDFIASSFYKLSKDGIKRHILLQNNDPFKALFISNLGITSANLFLRKSVVDVQGWDEDLKSSQEANLMYKLLLANSAVVFDNIPRTVIREREAGQISQQDPNNNWIQYINLRLEIIKFLTENRAEYFNHEKEFYLSNLFKQIRRVAQFDLDRAVLIYKTNFPDNFEPNINVVYSICFKIFGFKTTEQILSKLLRIFLK